MTADDAAKARNAQSTASIVDGVRDEGLTPDDAYALMADLGVGYSTTARDLHRAGIAAQAARRLDAGRAKAWADLRRVEHRLALDMTFAEVAQTTPLPDAALPLDFEPLSPPTLGDLAAALPAPDVAAPPPVSTELPLPVVDVWALALELIAREAAPVLLLPDPEPLVTDAKENLK